MERSDELFNEELKLQYIEEKSQEVVVSVYYLMTRFRDVAKY